MTTQSTSTEDKKVDVGVQAQKMCNFITDCGGEVNLNNENWNTFEHMLWDVWEDGWKTATGFYLAANTIQRLQGK